MSGQQKRSVLKITVLRGDKKMYSEKDFIEAFCWMYSVSKAEADKAYMTSSKKYIEAIIDCYKSNCKKAFYED